MAIAAAATIASCSPSGLVQGGGPTGGRPRRSDVEAGSGGVLQASPQVIGEVAGRAVPLSDRLGEQLEHDGFDATRQGLDPLPRRARVAGEDLLAHFLGSADRKTAGGP